MAPQLTRTQILEKLRGQIAQGQTIVGAGAGIGLSAKFVEAGGGDLIIIYNSGRFRMAGRGSLAGLMPYGNANDIVVDMVQYLTLPTYLPTYLHLIILNLSPLPLIVTYSCQNAWATGIIVQSLTKKKPSIFFFFPTTQAKEVLPVVKHTPVLAGVCGTDPYVSMPRFLAKLRDLGFAGIQNFPTVGLIDGEFRAALEETGMGYDLEVEMIELARSMDLLTTPYVFNVEEAKKMASAGADILVAHMGLTTGGSIGKGEKSHGTKSLDDCVKLIQDIRNAAKEINPEVIVLCHGGPIAKPEDAEYVLSRTEGVHGFYGASSMERLPVEEAITNITKSFKALKTGK